MSNLETYLDENAAPATRSSLSAQILAAAEIAEPANDTKASRPWWSIGGVAAMAVMAAIFLFQPTPAEPDVEWDQIADASGFMDLYEWVEGDGS